MKEIPLTRGYVAIVSDEDYDELIRHKWYATGYAEERVYAARGIRLKPGKRAVEFMHRRITGAAKGLDVDHINRNTLDNRRSNLRVCTRAMNIVNAKLFKTNTSGYRGVSWNKQKRVWIAYGGHNDKYVHIGTYRSIDEAIKARDSFAKARYGEFAVLNLPQ